MSYPQPDSDKYAQNGDFFRLNTVLTTPGDVYESQQGSHAFGIGAGSDIASVNIGYFDGQVPTFLNTLQLGQTRSWVGRINARNDAVYVPSDRKGRVLIWPADLYDPVFFPTGFDPNLDTMDSITPVLEVIQYFQPQGSLEVKRNDKVYRFQELNFPARNAYTVIPYWGRRYASLRAANFTLNDMEWAVSGITYYFNNQVKAIETPIDSATIAAGAQHQTIISDSANGMFDAIMLTTQATPSNGPTPILVITSDSPRGV